MESLDVTDQLVRHVMLPLMLPLGVLLLFCSLFDVVTRPAGAPRVTWSTLALAAFLTAFPLLVWFGVAAQREANDVITAVHPIGVPRAALPTSAQRFVVDLPSGYYTLSGDLQGLPQGAPLQLEDRGSGRAAVCTVSDPVSGTSRRCWWRVRLPPPGAGAP